ncbi:hypothetical protein [Rhizobium sullae]|uniref:aspartate-alanine antiporter-like transporter n=1 Tax=Rhizobium sullae TaxID=50338 RepID=UPI0012FD5666|nr:hypothetical protein [Rhizobium sullae]
MVGEWESRNANRPDAAAGLLCVVLIASSRSRSAGCRSRFRRAPARWWRGLLFGWWHARYPGRANANAPVVATQIMWDPRLAAFCALVGLTAGPQALAALATDGPTILVAGVVVTLVPLIVGLGVGHFLLGINSVALVGALAGAHTQDPAMLSASDLAESPAPALGFTVPYAIGNILLTNLGPVVALS